MHIYLGCRVHSKFKLALLAVVNRKSFHEQGREARSGAATERVEDQEPLQPGAHVCQLADPKQNNDSIITVYSNFHISRMT